MQNLIKVFPLVFTSFASMSFANRACDISFVTILEDDVGIRVKVGIKTNIIDSSKAFLARIYIKGVEGEKRILSYNQYYFRIGSFEFENSISYPYEKLSEDSVITVQCYPDIKDSEVETITCPYVATRFANKNITISENDNNKIITPKYLISHYKIDDNPKYTIYNDQFIFKNYEDNIVCPVYKNFDMSALRFNYKNGGDNILKGNFNLCLYDAYNLFPCFPLMGDTMYRQIPLTPNKDGEDYYFAFKDSLYYDPATFKMAAAPQDGYYKTSLLFMPKGYYQKMNTIKCRLTMDINSFYSYNIQGEFHIHFLKNYIGDCSDSEYCINVSADYGENYRGKSIEVIL